MKIACVIQGDIRKGTDIIVPYMKEYFDVVILSTWENQVIDGNWADGCELLLNHLPKVPGFSHRNYQRKSTAAGIEKAKKLGCTHVLKWRTDMLPTKLDVFQLLEWSNYKIPKGVSSRIVMCAFRNLTVSRDWFSSIPDLFSFGKIDMMELLWGDSGFNYSLNRNIPEEMFSEEGPDCLNDDVQGQVWSAESELYAHLKRRLEMMLSVKLTHEQIAKNYTRLIDHEKLGIIWFGDNGFRPIFQAWQHNWWTESMWASSKSIKRGEYGYLTKGFLSKLRGKLSFILSSLEIYKQWKSYKQLSKSRRISK